MPTKKKQTLLSGGAALCRINDKMTASVPKCEIFLKPICISKSLIPVIFFVCTRKINSFEEQLEQVSSTTFVSYQQIALKINYVSADSCRQHQSFGYPGYCLFLHNYVYTRRNLAVPINGCPTLCELALINCQKVRFKIKVLLLYFGVHLDYERVVPCVKSEIYEQN